MKPAGGQPASQPLKYKTWVLRVSIDCEGCKKKVKKILQGIEGVYATAINAQQHEVTVTGDVEADTLIKKLSRSGKLAEIIWSGMPENKEKKNLESPVGNKIQNNPKVSDDYNQESKTEDDDGENPAETAIKETENISEEEERLPEAEEPVGGQIKKNKRRKKKKKKQSKPPTGDSGSEGNDREPDMVLTAKGSPVPQPQPLDVDSYAVSANHSTTMPVYGMSYSTAAPYSGAIGTHFAAPVVMAADPVVRLPPYDPIRFNGHGEDVYHHDYDDESGCFIM